MDPVAPVDPVAETGEAVSARAAKTASQRPLGLRSLGLRALRLGWRPAWRLWTMAAQPSTL